MEILLGYKFYRPAEQNDKNHCPFIRLKVKILTDLNIPFFLLQALMFYLPVVIWRSMNSRTGIDLNDIIETAEKFQFTDDLETKNKVLFFLTKQTDR